MRKLISTTFLSLDGVMQAPGGPQEDVDGGFRLGGWSVNYFDEMVGQRMEDTMGKPFDLVLGRKTYDIFAAYWPNASEEEGAGPLNDATKYVASRSPLKLTWDKSVQLQGDVADAVQALKNEDGRELQIHGSSDLLQTLHQHRLIDEYRILTFPVVIGKGKRLFGETVSPVGLELIDNRVSKSGVVMSCYTPTGDVQTGLFGA